jgi:hypothetical protein
MQAYGFEAYRLRLNGGAMIMFGTSSFRNLLTPWRTAAREGRPEPGMT